MMTPLPDLVAELQRLAQWKNLGPKDVCRGELERDNAIGVLAEAVQILIEHAAPVENPGHS